MDVYRQERKLEFEMRWNRDTDDDLAACKMKLETDLSNMKKAVEEV